MNAAIARDSDVTTLRHRYYYQMPLLCLIACVTNARAVFESKGGRKGEEARGRERIARKIAWSNWNQRINERISIIYVSPGLHKAVITCKL